MKHQRQRDRECMLAAAAILADRDYEQMRLDEGTEWIAHLAAADKIEPPGEVVPWQHWHHIANRLFDSLGIENNLNHSTVFNRVDRLDGRKLRGKGILLLRWIGSTGHAVAFEDGVIYDPYASAPLPLAAWLKQLREWEMDIHRWSRHRMKR